MKVKKNAARLLILAAASLCAVSCGEPSGQSGTDSATSSASSEAATKYLVTFNPLLDGLSPTRQQVTAGSSIAAPTDITKAQWENKGWCTEYDPVTRFGKEGTEVTFPYTPTGNVVLYGRWQKQEKEQHTEDEVEAYVAEITAASVKNHLYFHYYRFDNTASSYSDWDVWAWPYRPTEGEGTRFDWKGRTTSADKLSATGDAIVDGFGGAVVDIDLSADYTGGTKSGGKAIDTIPVSFYADKEKTTLDTQIGIQVVKSSSRTKPEGKFWTNDGGDLHIDLTDPEQAMEVETSDGGKAWHVFSLQDKVATYQGSVIQDMSDPFDGDHGEKVTYKNGSSEGKYNDVKWNEPAPKQATSGWKNSVGVGYQIQVASFADSDGDGFGDIYGITSKLPYLKKLGVKALWLTPVQKSDSYHGYDISDYTKVDEKFGSKVSTAALANDGKVTEATAMADYKELIDKAHENGMKIVMDLVLNHTSVSNKWFINSAQLNDSYRGYYQWGNHETDSTVTEAKCWFPYGDHPYSYYAKFGSSMPELNYQYKATRDAVNAMSIEWVNKGVDGFRLDAVKHIFMKDETATASGDTIIVDKAAKGDYSSNLTKNLHFYKELNQKLKAVKSDVFLVGENFDGHAYHVAPWYEAFDSMFDFYGYFNLTSAAAKALGNFSAGPSFSTFMSTGGQFNLDSSIQDNGHIYDGVAGTNTWDLPSVLNAYNKYRGGSAMPGFFTSNHDIARVINRVAGTQGTSTGLDEQGTITTGNYSKFAKAANLVKSIEILMPGCTWIYYGDEIGMTGNFPTGKDSTSDYADLWWRQPMKWKQDGAVGDGSMTTGFSITGSGATIQWDNVNKTATVEDANSQENNANSQYNKLAQVIAYKNNNPSLITGTVSNNGSTETEMKFKNGNITITANFVSGTITATGGTGSLNITF